MPTQQQLDKIAEDQRHAKYEDFKPIKDINAENPDMIIYKGYDEHFCQACGGSIIYPTENRGICISCCQGFILQSDTVKPVTVTNKKKIRVSLNDVREWMK